MSMNNLRKETLLLHKTLNLDQSTIGWRKRAEDITQLLKQYEAVSESEKTEQTESTYKWYCEEYLDGDKAWLKPRKTT